VILNFTFIAAITVKVRGTRVPGIVTLEFASDVPVRFCTSCMFVANVIVICCTSCLQPRPVCMPARYKCLLQTAAMRKLQPQSMVFAKQKRKKQKRKEKKRVKSRRDEFLQHPLLEIQCKEGPEGQSQSLSGKHG
jgi:hypothetical protein